MAIIIHIFPRRKVSLHKVHPVQGYIAEVISLTFELESMWTLPFSATVSSLYGRIWPEQNCGVGSLKFPCHPSNFQEELEIQQE